MHELLVTYLYHSGFSVALGDTLLIFDYIPESSVVPGAPEVLTQEQLARFRQVVVFVSHSHEDHFNPIIFDWADPGRVHYILGYDVPAQWPGFRMRPGESLTVADCRIEAFNSTDMGVSYLVTAGDYTIFHAGDLNLWHWRDVSTLHEIEEAERDFHAAVKPLEGRDIDLAFFPVDPRLGSLYDAGANYFVMAVKPHVLIPMHWQGRTDVAQEYVRKNRTRRVEMTALVRPGDAVEVGKRQHSAEEAPIWYYQVITRSVLEERSAVAANEVREATEDAHTDSAPAETDGTDEPAVRAEPGQE